MVFGGLLKAVGKSTYKTFGKVFSTAVTTPANIITAGLEKVTGKKYGRTTAKEFSESSFGKKLTKAAAVPAAGLVIAAGAGGRAASLAKSLVPATIKGKVITGTSALIGYGVLKSSPKAQKTVEKAIVSLPDKPSKIIGLGKGIGQVIEKKKKFTAKDVGKALAVAGIVGGAAAGAAVILPKIKEKFTKEKAVVPEVSPGVFEATPEQAQQLVKEKPIGIEGTPQTPQTTKITTGRKPYKRRRAKKTPSVRQSVRVNVINRSTGIRNTNYIKERLYN